MSDLFCVEVSRAEFRHLPIEAQRRELEKSANGLNLGDSLLKRGRKCVDGYIELKEIIRRHQSQLAALKLENEKLVPYLEHKATCRCYESRYTDSARTPEMRVALAAQCTCGLTALRAEIERVKGGK